jgi:hypothetical protein
LCHETLALSDGQAVARRKRRFRQMGTDREVRLDGTLTVRLETEGRYGRKDAANPRCMSAGPTVASSSAPKR